MEIDWKKQIVLAWISLFIIDSWYGNPYQDKLNFCIY